MLAQAEESNSLLEAELRKESTALNDLAEEKLKLESETSSLTAELEAARESLILERSSSHDEMKSLQDMLNIRQEELLLLERQLAQTESRLVTMSKAFEERHMLLERKGEERSSEDAHNVEHCCGEGAIQDEESQTDKEIVCDFNSQEKQEASVHTGTQTEECSLSVIQYSTEVSKTKEINCNGGSLPANGNEMKAMESQTEDSEDQEQTVTTLQLVQAEVQAVCSVHDIGIDAPVETEENPSVQEAESDDTRMKKSTVHEATVQTDLAPYSTCMECPSDIEFDQSATDSELLAYNSPSIRTSLATPTKDVCAAADHVNLYCQQIVASQHGIDALSSVNDLLEDFQRELSQDIRLLKCFNDTSEGHAKQEQLEYVPQGASPTNENVYETEEKLLQALKSARVQRMQAEEAISGQRRVAETQVACEEDR